MTWLGEATARHASLQHVLELALDHCLELTRSELGYLDLLDADGHRELAAFTVGGIEAGLVQRFASLAVHARIAADVIVRRQIRISNAAGEDPERLQVPEGHPPIERFMSAPLVANGVVLGLVTVAGKRARYTRADARRLSLFAEQLAVSVGYGRLYERELEQTADLRRRSRESSDRAASDERQRLARELHDSASQAVYGIALAAQAVRRTAPGEGRPERLTQRLDLILQLSEVALAEMRALIFGLRPESLAEEGLTAGLQKLTAAVAARHRLDVHLVADAEPDLDIQVKEGLYRIAQEALQNAVKHASASSVTVRLQTDGGNVELEVIDDGAGFEPRANRPGHIGLHSMQERARALNLELAVDSRPGAGAEVRVRTPVAARRSPRVLPWG